MNSSRIPIRRRWASVALGAAVLVLSACGTGPVGRSVVATVDGRDISQEQVTDLMDAERRYFESLLDNPEIDRQAVAQRLALVTGDGDDTYSMEGARLALQSWITYSAVLAELERNGESVTDEDREAARADLAAQVGGEAGLESVDPELLAFNIDSAAATIAIERVVSADRPSPDREQRLLELYEEVAPQRPLCLNAIISETEADSVAARARVDDGDPFATVAAEMSLDPNAAMSGGSVGCAPLEEWAEIGDLSTAAEGDLIGPIAVTGGFVVIEVASTTGPTLEQLRPELEQQVAAEEANEVPQYLFELTLAARVEVDPRFGTWDPETGVLAPATA